MLNKSRKTTALFWERPSYQLVGTDSCYVFAFRDIPELDTAPLRTQGPTIIHPGDLIRYASGRKTSAGFPNLHMIDGFALRYMGAVQGEGDESNSKLICFEQTHGGEPVITNLAGFTKVYWGFSLLPDNSWHFVTPAWSSRVVETHDIRLQHVLPSPAANSNPPVETTTPGVREV